MEAESDGNWQSVRWRLQGVFRDTFALKHFPFDRQSLTIQLEYPSKDRVLKADLGASGMAGEFSIVGWEYEPYFQANNRLHLYNSSLGSVFAKKGRRTFNSLVFTLELHRPPAAYIIKFILPLLIIIGMSMVSLYLPREYIDVWIGIIITALLSVVALNFTLAESLPDTSELTMADEFFIIVYVLIFLALVESVLIMRLRAARPELTNRLERVSSIVLPALMIFICSIALSSSLYRIERAGIDDVASLSSNTVFPSSSKRSTPSPGAKGSANRILRIRVAGISSAVNSDMGSGFLWRGLLHARGEGESLPFLARSRPGIETGRVRFLPRGGMRVRWSLRPAMVWAGGREIDVDDILFSLKYKNDPLIESFRRVDKYTVDIVYKLRLFSNLEGFTVYPRFFLENAFRAGGRKNMQALLNTKPTPSNGPFLLESFEKNKRLVYRRNPDFQGNRPYFEKIEVLRTFQDRRGNFLTATESIKRGLVDIHPMVSHVSARQAQKSPGVSLLSNLRKRFLYLQPGLPHPPLDNILVRRAVTHAIHRRKVLETHDSISAVVSDTYRHKGDDDYHPGLGHYDYNPRLSRKLLGQAGLTLPVRIQLIRSANMKDTENPTRLAVERIMADLKRGGFAPKHKVVNTTWSIAKNANHRGLLLRLSSYRMPESVWNIPFKNNNYQLEQPRGVYDREAMELIKEYLGCFFKERRRILSRRIQELWNRRLPLIPLGIISPYMVYNARLKGPAPIAENYWWNIEDWYME